MGASARRYVGATAMVIVRSCAQIHRFGDTKGGITALQGILTMPNLGSRHYLQTYSQLRQLGFDTPSERAKDVLGVVVEVGTDKGPDLVAAYADHHARYFNYSGAAVIWERPDGRLDDAINNLLGSGSRLAQAIGPGNGERPSAPRKGQARVNILVASALHFGEGPLTRCRRIRWEAR